MGSSQYSRIHPDDVGKVARVSDDFAHHRSDYDQLIRCRRADGYHLLHVIGFWQTMPDGMELAFLTYTDVSASKKTIEDSALKYLLFQQDQFYRDPLTGLPNINYMHEFADERIGAIRAEGKTPVLVYSDVVSMQFYNNQYGFTEGDELIRLAKDTGVRFCAILTGLNDVPLLQESIRLQVCDYLIKPVNKEELYALIRRTREQIAQADTEQEDELADRFRSGA